MADEIFVINVGDYIGESTKGKNNVNKHLLIKKFSKIGGHFKNFY